MEKKAQGDEEHDEEEEKVQWFSHVDAEVVQQMVFDIASAPTTKER